VRLEEFRRRRARRDDLVARAAGQLGLRLGRLSPAEHAAVLDRADELDRGAAREDELRALAHYPPKHRLHERFTGGREQSYRAVCACTWVSEPFASLGEAQMAGRAHLASAERESS